ncbi:prolyl 4-hydroxylase [Pycnococcus provasolii]
MVLVRSHVSGLVSSGGGSKGSKASYGSLLPHFHSSKVHGGGSRHGHPSGSYFSILIRLSLAALILFVIFLLTIIDLTPPLPKDVGQNLDHNAKASLDRPNEQPKEAYSVVSEARRVSTHDFSNRIPGVVRDENTMASDSEPPTKDFIDPTRIEVLSYDKPRAYVYRNFLTQEECDHIVRKAKPSMIRSGVVDVATGQSKTDDVRTSSGTFFANRQDEIITRVERRLANWTQIPEENSEGLQVLRYEASQQYRPHYDYFFHESGKKNNRIATVLMYLSDVEEGGETVFPHAEPGEAQKSAPDGTYSECAMKGLAIKPRKGDALLFWTLKVGGELDHGSNHAGCPVIEGVKWSATKWIHVGPLRSHRSGHIEYHEPKNVGPPKYLPDGSPCKDGNSECEMWAEDGECKKNPGYMSSQCRLSCDTCSEA